jgi:hypothetical protein
LALIGTRPIKGMFYDIRAAVLCGHIAHVKMRLKV